MPSITILYFASIRTHLGIERELITLPPDESRITDLPSAIIRQHPEDPKKLKALLEACMWCVDEEMVDLEDVDGEGARVLKGGEVVAVIPPVSGG
jgi:molybdopterin converting factor small subunit